MPPWRVRNVHRTISTFLYLNYGKIDHWLEIYIRLINFCSGLPGQHHKQIMINDAAYRSLFPEFGKCCSLPHSLHAEYGKYCRLPLFCCWNLFQNDNALSALFTQRPKNQNCLLLSVARIRKIMCLSSRQSEIFCHLSLSIVAKM